MALINANWNPSERQLKQFGGASLLFFPLTGWALLGFRLPGDWSPVAWQVMGALALIGVLLAVIAAVKPGAIRPLFVAVSLLTFPIGIVVGELTLLCIYFGVFLPVAVIFRIMRRDALARHSGRDGATTYWSAKRSPGSIEQYFHQY